MALNSDRDGFLVADERVQGNDLTQGIRGVKKNTDAILAILKGRQRSLDRSRITNPNDHRSRQRGPGSPAPAPSEPGSPPQRRTRTPGQGDSGAEVAGEVRQLTRQQAQQNAERERAEESRRTREGSDQVRDARGRFGSGGGGGGEGAEDEKKSMFSRMKDFFKDRSGDAIGDVDKVDPVIESANEVMGMVGGAVSALKATGELGKAVIGRGFGGQRDRATPWYKKLLQQLKLMRRDDGEFHRAELRALREQEGGGGGGSFIGDILKLLFGPVGAALVGAAALAWATMGSKISGAWQSFIAAIKEKWDSAVKTFTSIWDAVAKFFADKLGIVTTAVGTATEQANTVVKDATGIDLKAAVKEGGKNIATVADKAAEKAGSLLEKIKPGYRHKATFGDISGGDNLTKYGRYTDDEAEKIRQLKAGGANTSANLPGGMTAKTREKIVAQSREAGVDPEMMLKFAAIESGGNSNAISSTGAIGTYQMTGGTASNLGIKDRFDEDQNIAGGIALVKENAAILDKAKLPKTAENLYMMHQLGPEAAKEVIQGAAGGKKVSDLSGETQAAMAKNYGAGSKTASEYMGKNKAALEARYASVVKPGASPAVASKSGTKQAAMTPPGTPGTVSPTADGRAAAMPAPTAQVTGTPAPLSGPPSVPPVSIAAQSPPPPAARADVPMPLSSKPPIEVRVSGDKMAGQDVRDRRLAHIATGGMAGG